jgi:serine protease
MWMPPPWAWTRAFAWSNGYAAAGVKICDVEYDWNATHEDCRRLLLLGATPLDTGFGNDHGTAVLGELGGKHNTNGVRGISPMARPYAWPVPMPPLTAATISPPPSVRPMTNLVAGDVILIEQQGVGPVGEYVPVSWWKPNYDAIRTAVSNGVIVVEAAGQWRAESGRPVYSTGNGGHWPFLPQNDSGSIMVGAGRAPAVSQPAFAHGFFQLRQHPRPSGLRLSGGHPRLRRSQQRHHQPALHLHLLRHLQRVAHRGRRGAVLQQMWKARYTNAASPALIRQLLRSTGTPQQGSDNIGPLPDLRAAFSAVTNQARWRCGWRD